MKISCKSCNQPIEVDEGADLTGAQCPACGSTLVTARSSPPNSTNNKTSPWLCGGFAVILASISLILAIYCIYRIQKMGSGDEWRIASADPNKTAKDYYRVRNGRDYWTAGGAFWRAHSDEILKTFEIVSTSTQDDYCLALVRFSVGDKVFRDGLWLKRVDGLWYGGGYINLYQPKPEIALHLEWFKQAEEKREAWEKESAGPVP